MIWLQLVDLLLWAKDEWNTYFQINRFFAQIIELVKGTGSCVIVLLISIVFPLISILAIVHPFSFSITNSNYLIRNKISYNLQNCLIKYFDQVINIHILKCFRPIKRIYLLYDESNQSFLSGVAMVTFHMVEGSKSLNWILRKQFDDDNLDGVMNGHLIFLPC